ncbi:MAG: DUF1697 domain-containing protein [Thermoplasmata archaeon]
MPVYVALLRAVNLGGPTTLRMADLRAMATRLGFTSVTTLLQSGNLVFGWEKARDEELLERRIETATAETFGITTDVHVRRAEAWAEVVENNPFGREAKEDPAHLVVVVVRSALKPGRVAELERRITGRERIRSGGRHLYIVYPDGIGRSKLTTALIDAGLGVRGTARNWNTVGKILAASRAVADSGTRGPDTRRRAPHRS